MPQKVSYTARTAEAAGPWLGCPAGSADPQLHWCPKLSLANPAQQHQGRVKPVLAFSPISAPLLLPPPAVSLLLPSHPNPAHVSGPLVHRAGERGGETPPGCGFMAVEVSPGTREHTEVEDFCRKSTQNAGAGLEMPTACRCARTPRCRCWVPVAASSVSCSWPGQERAGRGGQC